MRSPCIKRQQSRPLPRPTGVLVISPGGTCYEHPFGSDADALIASPRGELLSTTQAFDALHVSRREYDGDSGSSSSAADDGKRLGYPLDVMTLPPTPPRSPSKLPPAPPQASPVSVMQTPGVPPPPFDLSANKTRRETHIAADALLRDLALPVQ
mmetsp:Transcript_3196/g.9377  ORF Transcript_3196/g.9377 Transcript_3196/m.9377 type:complete len:154 (+) Transcript_3196:192-653(+)